MEDTQTGKMRELFTDNELSTEQLEEVAGGNKYHTADDSCFLNVLLRGRPGQCNRYGDFRAGTCYESTSIRKEVEAAWASIGIKFTTGNRYPYTPHYLDSWHGKILTREGAYELAMQRVGKRLKKSDWYWE